MAWQKNVLGDICRAATHFEGNFTEREKKGKNQPAQRKHKRCVNERTGWEVDYNALVSCDHVNVIFDGFFLDYGLYKRKK